MKLSSQAKKLNSSLESCLNYVQQDELFDEQIAQRLGNVIQGKFLDHLADHISRYHQIQNKTLIA